MQAINSSVIERIAEAARDKRHITGFTHNFYRYPARFSPQFAAAAIECFSKPCDLVLDPYMGGATTVLEAMISGRRAIGSDINQLSVFVAQAKLLRLSKDEQAAIVEWTNRVVHISKCNKSVPTFDCVVPRNMTLPKVRWIRKTISLLIASLQSELPNDSTRHFARCVLLNTGQWALNGRKRVPSVNEFREHLVKTSIKMIEGISSLDKVISESKNIIHHPLIRENDAARIDSDKEILTYGLADLVVTSPPYPGIHMLYHRWQVDGRKESDAPYWITGCKDGAGVSYYNFSDRREKALNRYFDKAEASFSAIRRVIKQGAVLVQMIAFSDPKPQLPRYMRMMEASGFSELRNHGEHRVWRDVPGRNWHATSKGNLPSSKEVVLIHEAI
jgi:DNA modification methylase